MRKKFCKSGIIVSALVVLLGILILAGVMGGNTSTASGASYSYDSGYASFGADFYTYVSNNAEEAASAGRTAASNLDKIADLLKNVTGFGFIALGLLCICGFGAAMAEPEGPKAENVAEPIPVTPVSAAVPEKTEESAAKSEPAEPEAEAVIPEPVESAPVTEEKDEKQA